MKVRIETKYTGNHLVHTVARAINKCFGFRLNEGYKFLGVTRLGWLLGHFERAFLTRKDKFEITWRDLNSSVLAKVNLAFLRRFSEEAELPLNVDSKDLPKELRRRPAGMPEDEFYRLRSDYILGEIIFALSEISEEGCEWFNLFYTTEPPEGLVKDVDYFEVEVDPYIVSLGVEAKEIDNRYYRYYNEKAHKEYEKRMENGLRLFGKYFKQLWI